MGFIQMDNLNLGGNWQGEERGDNVGVMRDELNPEEFTQSSSPKKAVFDKIRHEPNKICKIEHVVEESYSTGGFGTKTMLTAYCNNCHKRSEPYPLGS